MIETTKNMFLVTAVTATSLCIAGTALAETLPPPPPPPPVAPGIAAPMPAPARGSVGVGLGVPYGVLGVSGDLAVHDHVSLTVGIGTTIFAGVGYNAGAKLFFMPSSRRWRPRVSAYYGTNSMIVIEGSTSSAEKFLGLTLGAGVQRTFGASGRHGIDLDLMIVTTNGGMQEEMERLEDQHGVMIPEPGRVKVSTGYRYVF